MKKCICPSCKDPTTMLIIAQFTAYLTQVGYSKSTTKMLPYCVESFLTHSHYQKQNLESITPTTILQFYEYLQERPNKKTQLPLSEMFINHHLYGLKVFFNWLETTNQLAENPISNLKFKQPKVNSREPLSQQEIQALFEASENQTETAILHLFYSCGLRRTEAVSLNIKDIHFNEKLLYIREGKGGKRRVIPITAKVSKALESYLLNERPQLNKHQMNTDAFMLNNWGERMQGDTYNKTLKQIIARTTITKEKISLHHLRHSIATHLLENGLSIEYVRDFLGHKHLESTQIYVKVNLRSYEL